MQPSFIGKGLLPETGCLLLTGRTETGKSVIAFDMAVSLASGAPLFHAKRGEEWLLPVTRPANVLYLDSELGPPGAHARLKAFYETRGIETLGDRFKLVSGAYDQLLLHVERDSDAAFRNLEKLIAIEKPDVLVVDPFSDYHLLDENDNQIRVVFKQLRWLQAHYKFASILVHHESDKDSFSSEGRPIKREGTGRARGHSAIAQSVDTMLSVRRGAKRTVTSMEATWEKCRHQQRPPNGFLLVDFQRMHVEWLGTTRAVHSDYLTGYLEAYRAQHPESKDSDE